MRIHQNESDEEAPVNLMPLIDMVFLLLIFFLVATTISQEEREQKMQLPKDGSPTAMSAPPKQLIINIMEDGSKKISGIFYKDADLKQLLIQTAENEPGREVLIRADERSIHKYFAGVASLCKSVGINELKIGYIFDPKRVVLNNAGS